LTTVIETQFFGPIAAFASLPHSQLLLVERCEHWQKMSYRNRAQVLGQQAVLNLSIPIVGGRDQRQPIDQMRIDYNGRWKQEHWRTLESLYNRSPYFEHYAPALGQLWWQQPALLIEWNFDLLKWVVQQLRWSGSLRFTDEYQPVYPAETSLDWRGRFLPKNRLSFSMPAYQQVFGQRFEPNLSILDLLFNAGPHSWHYLLQLSHTPASWPVNAFNS
jgi:hypothetical protein